MAVIKEGFGVALRPEIAAREAPLRLNPVAFSYALRAKYPLGVKTSASIADLYYQPEVRSESKPVLLEVEK